MSTVSKISEYLESQKAGTTFINSDFSSYGDDASVRSALVRLCEKNMLTRICQGVYMKPGYNSVTPDSTHIASEIARRSGAKIALKEDTTVNNIRFLAYYTNASTRSVILNNGTVIRFIHSNSLV